MAAAGFALPFPASNSLLYLLLTLLTLLRALFVSLCCRWSEAQSCFGEVVAVLADPPGELESAHTQPLALLGWCQ